MLHIALHFVLPLGVALFFAPTQWRKVYVLMIATMLVDVDHLLADPIYDPNRCSIGFHPLHTLYPILLYGVMSLLPYTRWVGVGLLLHMGLDSIDCQVNQGLWWNE